MLSYRLVQSTIMGTQERHDGIPHLAKGVAMALPPPPYSKKKVRKHLSADALYALVGGSFAQVPDPRRPGS